MTPLSLVPAPAEPRSPLPAVAAAAFAIFALGTAFYALGVTPWSGQRVVALDVARERETFVVRLDPAMSPVRVVAHIGDPPAPGRANPCRVALRDARGRTVWSKAREFDAHTAARPGRPGSATTWLVETFTVPSEGEYTFAVEFGAGGNSSAPGSWLEVRRQVSNFQIWFVAAGVLLALASLGLALAASRRDGRAGAGRSRAA